MWIVGVFCTSLTAGIETIASLIPIHLHIQKLNDRFHLRVHLLLENHIINSMIEAKPLNHAIPYQMSLEWLILKQHSIIKGPIMDINNKFNEKFSSFSSFNSKFTLENRLIDIFSKYFSFHFLNSKCKCSIKSHLCKLEKTTIQMSSNYFIAVVVADTSIKNSIVTSIVHVYVHNSPVIKTIHHTVNTTSTIAKLFTIRCRINQVFLLPDIKRIVIISDSIHVAKRIFNSSAHPYQIHLAAISCKLREFFKKGINNSIKFWNCPSHCK